MSHIGPVQGRHVNLSSLSVAVLIFGILLVAVAILLLVVRDRANPEAASLVLNVMLISGIGGILVIALGLFLRRRRWVQGELGVQRLPDDTTWLYTDIAETCQFYRYGMSVGLAWRRNGETGWTPIDARTGGYLKFLQRFMDGYHAARVPVLLEKLEAGHTVGFQTLSAGGRLKSIFSLGVKQYANMATQTVQLSRYRIAFPHSEVSLASVVDVDVSSWTERLVFKLRDGSQVTHSYTTLFDAQLLLILVQTLLEANTRDTSARS